MSTAQAAPDLASLDLSFERPVRRGLAHKAAVEQVLVTDFARIADDEFACACHLPRAHRFFNDGSRGHYDPLLLLEAGRQAVVLGIHEVMDVPRENEFVFVQLELEVVDVAALAIGREPAQLVGYSRAQNRRYVSGEPVGVEVVGDLFVDGTRCVTIVGSGAFMGERMYKLVRRRAKPEPDPAWVPAEPAPAALVGRSDPANVVISPPEPRADAPGAFATEVVVDQGHATFFDHPLDHVPGMLLVEALRQTALASACEVHGLDPAAAILTGCTAKYGRYGELGSPIGCEATVGDVSEPATGDHPRVAVELGMSQFGRSIADARLTLDFLG